MVGAQIERSRLAGRAGTRGLLAVGRLCALIAPLALAGCGDSAADPDPDAGSDAAVDAQPDAGWTPSSCNEGAFGRGTWQIRCAEGATECDVRTDHEVRACIAADVEPLEADVTCTIYPPNSPTDTTALTFDLRDDGSVLRVWARLEPDGSFAACQVGVLEDETFWVDSTDDGDCGPLDSDNRCRVDIERVEEAAERPGFRGSAICRGLDERVDVTAPDGGPVEFFVDGCDTMF